MLIRLEVKKSTLSTWMILFFAAVLFITGFYSDFFQAPIDISPEMSRYRSLFQPSQILGVRELILKNNLGTFHFEKSSSNPDTPWMMISPRKLPANSSLVKTILKDLNNVQIRSVHANDPINIANYSLDTASLEVTLINSNDKASTLKFGLINPLDNSTYVSLSDQDAIYHIDNISTTLNTLDLASFVDTRIFTFDLSSVTSIKIYRGQESRNNLNFLAEKNGLNWVGQKNLMLKTEAVKEYLGGLADLRSPLILDRVSEELAKAVEQYLEKPSFLIVVTDNNKNKYTYKISGLVRNLPGVKLEKWQNFIIQPSNREFPYVLNKKVLGAFQRSERRLRSFPVKKLFY